MFITSVKDNEVLLFAGHTVRYFSWWFIVHDITFYLQ
jgi:hypothetical protein